jgi:vancomycin resistance protein VanW
MGILLDFIFNQVNVNKVMLEVFSFNEVLGPRTKDRGYREALEIVDGELVPGVGGGICQISSTLYNSVLLANLKIVTRVNHSRPVDYVELGRGATVYYDRLDFKFKNNTASLLVITSQVRNDRLIVSILGQKRGPKVEIVTSPEAIEPETQLKVDNSLAPGTKKVVRKGRTGFKVEVKRIIKHGEKIVNSELISTDIYSPQSQIIKVSPEE